MPSPIHHTYGPHVDRAYYMKTLLLSYAPWKYVRGAAPDRLKKALREKFGYDAILFGSGRESLLALLRAIDIRTGEEIIVQGYTCVVVPNAIHASGAQPIYADIDPHSLNLTVETVEPLITPRTRAVICQHTFGIPADTKALRALCDQHKILLIEDCAHVLPDHKGPKAIGTYSDFMILSFGRDKAISGISGGAVLSKVAKQTAVLRELERTAIPHSSWHVMKLLEYGARMHSIVRPLSGTIFLRPALWILEKAKLIVFVLTEEEKRGRMSPIFHKIPNACAELALYSLLKLGKLNERRRTITSFFLQTAKERRWPILRTITSDLPLQKFPLFVEGAEDVRKILKKENIHLDDGWTGCVICPSSINMDVMEYPWGKDPVAEEACLRVLSLPTHPTMTLFQAQKLAKRIDEILKK